MHGEISSSPSRLILLKKLGLAKYEAAWKAALRQSCTCTGSAAFQAAFNATAHKYFCREDLDRTRRERDQPEATADSQSITFSGHHQQCNVTAKEKQAIDLPSPARAAPPISRTATRFADYTVSKCFRKAFTDLSEAPPCNTDE